MRQNFTISGSGSEDIGGMRMSQEHVSRQENNTHRRAEDVHRRRRLDRDRLIATALADMMMHMAMRHPTAVESAVYLRANLQSLDVPAHSADLTAYVRALLDEIRASLSPVVTGKTTV